MAQSVWQIFSIFLLSSLSFPLSLFSYMVSELFGANPQNIDPTQSNGQHTQIWRIKQSWYAKTDLWNVKTVLTSILIPFIAPLFQYLILVHYPYGSHQLPELKILIWRYTGDGRPYSSRQEQHRTTQSARRWFCAPRVSKRYIGLELDQSNFLLFHQNTSHPMYHYSSSLNHAGQASFTSCYFSCMDSSRPNSHSLEGQQHHSGWLSQLCQITLWFSHTIWCNHWRWWTHQLCFGWT